MPPASWPDHSNQVSVLKYLHPQLTHEPARIRAHSTVDEYSDTSAVTLHQESKNAAIQSKLQLSFMFVLLITSNYYSMLWLTTPVMCVRRMFVKERDQLDLVWCVPSVMYGFTIAVCRSHYPLSCMISCQTHPVLYSFDVPVVCVETDVLLRYWNHLL